MASKKGGITVSVSPEQIMHTGVSRSKGGYNSAGFHAKIGDNEYMSVSYEWQGDQIPDFAMDLMSFMKANKEEIETASAALKEEFEAYSAKKKGKKPMMDNEDEEMMMDDEEEEQTTDNKKDKKKSKK